MRPLLLGAFLALLATQPAAAAVVTAQDADGGVHVIGVVDATGAPNRLLVVDDGDRVVVRERGRDALGAGEGCRQVAERTVACDASADQQYLVVTAGGGDDAVTVRARGRRGDEIRLSGGAGDDALTAVAARARLHGEDGADRLTGGARGDELRGGGGADRLSGGRGRDLLEGDGAPAAGIAADVIDGGPGLDDVTYFRRAAPVRVDLRRAAPAGSPGENDRLRRVEGAIGGSGADRLVGDGGPNRLVGHEGADVVDGGGGDDVLAINRWVNDPMDDGAPDRLRCGRGDDQVFDPLRLALPRSCERLSSSEYELSGEVLRAHPARLGRGRLRFHVTGPPDARVTGSHRRVTVRMGGVVVGRSRTVRLRAQHGIATVRLRRRIRPGAVLTVELTGEDDPRDPNGAAFAFSWRIRF